MRLKLALLFWAFVSFHAYGQLQPASVSIQAPDATNRWLRLKSTSSSETTLRLDATTDFSNWETIGTTHDKLWNFPDVTAENTPRRFYRVRSEKRTATNDWKNELLFPNEALRSPEGQELRWVKFLILLSDPTRVYYQDSSKFPFHYDYASQRLAPFTGMDRAAFDGISLRKAGQQVVLGTILYPPTPDYVEYGVQFVGQDTYTPDEISQWFELVKASVFATNGAGIYYMPVFEQSEMARTNSGAFTAKKIQIAAIERWISQDHIYSPGWAVGRLKYFSAVEIAAAFADGRLLPQDILLTDGVPAETPLVAGIISLTPSTPNSHTAILSRSFGIPFVHLPDTTDQARIQGLVGRKILIRAMMTWNDASVKIIDVQDTLPANVETELLALKKPEPIKFQAKASFGGISASTDTLGPSDIKYFGGKAANYGLLRDSIPDNCPVAIAFSFDLWDTFMDQTMPGGQTLRQRIAAILAPYTTYPPNITALKADLDDIRDMIRRNASFTAAQKQAITNALSIFDSTRNIRFRSSTNVEDSENFTGAGLYDSYSGCLLDDLDGDSVGPSICDPTEEDERGVFRAIQRVYASFYNDNAFLERLRHSVDETKVGMGVLVHHSFPDVEEMANGVATLQCYFSAFSTNLNGNLVTQLGAESVTNPDGSSVPEVVQLNMFSAFHDFVLTRRSSRVPLGGYVMDWQGDYKGFADLFAKIGARYRTVSGKTEFQLDYEYKKDTNLGLVVKQVREIPKAPTSGETTAFLFNEPTTYCVFQGEFSDVFGNHRLKSVWSLNALTLKMTPPNLALGLYREASVQYLSNAVLQSLSGPISSWPNATVSANAVTNSWTTGSGADQLAWRMETSFRTRATGAEPPIFTPQDFQITVAVKYKSPMPTLDYEGKPATTTEDVIMLRPCAEPRPGNILREYTFVGKGFNIETKYYWPKPPTGAVAGYTAPLVQFVQTTITGLTASPITLSNYYSQTYHPFHHNFSEEFIFEPRLDPNVSAEAIAQLEAANIRLIYVRRDSDGSPVMKALSPAGVFRDL